MVKSNNNPVVKHQEVMPNSLPANDNDFGTPSANDKPVLLLPNSKYTTGLSIFLLEKAINDYLQTTLDVPDIPEQVPKHIIQILFPEILKFENENITQKEVGKILGVSPKTIIDWRCETSPRKKPALIALEKRLSNGTLRFRSGDIYKLSESFKAGKVL